MKRIEVWASGYGRDITMTLRAIWGKADRILIVSPQEARLLAEQLVQAADAQECGMRILLASELASPGN